MEIAFEKYIVEIEIFFAYFWFLLFYKFTIYTFVLKTLEIKINRTN